MADGLFSRRALIGFAGSISAAWVGVRGARAATPAVGTEPEPGGLARQIAAIPTTAPSGLSGLVEPRPFLGKLNDAVSVFDFPGATAERAKPEAEQDWAPVLELALNACAISGRTLRIPVLGHRYWLRSISANGISNKADYAIGVVGNYVSVDQEPGSILAADPETFDGLTVTSLIGAMASPSPGPSDSFVQWRNLRVDMTGVDTMGSGVGGIDLYGFNSVVLEQPFADLGTTVPAGDDAGTGGVDTFGGTHFCNNIFVLHPIIKGAYDAAWYISGNNDGGNIRDGVGERATIVGGDYYRCSNTVTAKRDFFDFKHLGGSWFECSNGVQAGAAGGRDNHGRTWTLVGLHMRKMRGRPITLTKGIGDIVQDCRIFDYGLRISDQAYTGVRRNNPIAAIGLSGATAPNVGGNVCGFVDWSPPPGGTPGRQLHGIIFGRHTYKGSAFDTKAGLALGNTLFGMFRGELETQGAGNNNVFRNHVVGAAEPSIVGGANSSVVPLGTVRVQASKDGVDQADVATDALVTFPMVARNVGNFFNAEAARFAPLVAGDYAVTAQVLVSEGITADGQLFRLHVRKNGEAVATAGRHSSLADLVYVSVTCSVTLDGLTDFVEIVLSHDAGSGVTISGAPASTYFSATLIQ